MLTEYSAYRAASGNPMPEAYVNEEFEQDMAKLMGTENWENVP